MPSTPPLNDIDRIQLEAYRRMSGEERLRIGLGLYEASLDVSREAIRSRFPNADGATVEQKLRERIHAGYRIQAMKQSHADSVPVSLTASMEDRTRTGVTAKDLP